MPGPRRHRFDRKQRLASAGAAQQGDQRRTIRIYSRWYRINRLCAAIELHMLGWLTDDELARARAAAQAEAKAAEGRWKRKLEPEEEFDWGVGGAAPEWGISYIAGFTSGGAPYGLP